MKRLTQTGYWWWRGSSYGILAGIWEIQAYQALLIMEFRPGMLAAGLDDFRVKLTPFKIDFQNLILQLASCDADNSKG